jgi:hypothetical protein
MLLDPEDKGSMSLQNIWSHSPKDTMSHPARTESPAMLLEEPQILHPNFLQYFLHSFQANSCTVSTNRPQQFPYPSFPVHCPRILPTICHTDQLTDVQWTTPKIHNLTAKRSSWPQINNPTASIGEDVIRIKVKNKVLWHKFVWHKVADKALSLKLMDYGLSHWHLPKENTVTGRHKTRRRTS